MRSKLLLSLCLATISPAFAATINDSLPNCVYDTLANYAVNFGPPDGGACKIGNLAFSQFFFRELKVTSTSALTFGIEASDLYIQPVAATNSFNIVPSSTALFNRTITVPERYLISYNVDPPPIIAGDELYLDPPVGPVYGTKWGCTDSNFSPQAGTTEQILQNVGGRPGYTADTFKCGPTRTTPYILKTDGDPTTLPTVGAAITFPTPVAILNVRLVLDFEKGTTTGFEAIQTPIPTTIPEPATNIMLGGALLGLGALARYRKSR